MVFEDESQFMALKLSVEIGEEMIEYFPEVADMYREGKTQKEIAISLANNATGCKLEAISSIDVLEHAVRFALSGNDNPLYGEIYEGLMLSEEYCEIALDNISKNLRLNEIQKRKKHVNGAKARGHVIWNNYEKELAIEYKKEGMTYGQIAKRLNEEYHHEKIRTRSSIENIIRKHKRK